MLSKDDQTKLIESQVLIANAGYKPGDDVMIAMDAAASGFYDAENKVYHFKKSSGEKLTSSEMVSYWKQWYG